MTRATLDKSIEELEGRAWEHPGANAPIGLVRCYESRKKPISQLTASDLLFLIGRDVGLNFAMPKAIELLEINPLLEAEHFKGDLLTVVLEVTHQYFKESADARSRIERILSRLPTAVEALDEIDAETLDDALPEALARFRSS
jgi:contact-dependent growth inhibition (CDI) system CdiI-like immunity protein